MRRFLMTLAAIAAPTFASAATLQVDATGQLTGATGLDVGGALYDVSFREGTCIDLFGGCNEASDFTFTTEAGARAAGDALLAHVFVDGPLGAFDTDFVATAGCEATGVARNRTVTYTTCSAFVPYAAEDFGGLTGIVVSRMSAQNGLNFDAVFRSSGPFGDFDTAAPNGGSSVFAVFSLADPAPVPLPAAGWMLVAGLGALSLMRRRVRP